jgi:hypothetical protein
MSWATSAMTSTLVRSSAVIDFAAGVQGRYSAPVVSPVFLQYEPNNGDHTVHECTNTKQKEQHFKGGCTKFSHEEIQQLRMDMYDTFAMTWASEAFKTCNIILRLRGLHGLSKKPVVTDATSGCGGNVIQFACCERFGHVNAVELNKDRCKKFLTHNVNTALSLRSDRNNAEVKIICGDYLEHMKTLRQHVVFLAPPWGGPEYDTEEHCVLRLGRKHIADIVAELYEHKKKNLNQYVVIMTPCNFDVDDMQERLTEQSDLKIKLLATFPKWTLHVVSFYKSL